MLAKRSPAPILTGDRRRSPSPATSPRSPSRWSYDSDGVGLGIVAALDKPGHGHKPAVVVCSPRPISAAAARVPPAVDWADSESYTCVTCRSSPAQPPVTTVYYDGAEVGLPGGAKQDAPRNGGVFVAFMASPPSSGGEKIGFLPSDFLSYCHLCQKKLHGKDIFMYRGEKAFCSVECRYQQMVSDEYVETCGSEVTKASDVTVSAMAHDQFFLPGIAAA